MVELANIIAAPCVLGRIFIRRETPQLHGIVRHHAITSRSCVTLRADALRAPQLKRYV